MVLMYNYTFPSVQTAKLHISKSVWRQGTQAAFSIWSPMTLAVFFIKVLALNSM